MKKIAAAFSAAAALSAGVFVYTLTGGENNTDQGSLKTVAVKAGLENVLSGKMCLFDGESFTDSQAFCLNSGESVDDLSALSFANGTFNDKASSLINRTGIDYCIYSDSFYRGNEGRVTNVSARINPSFNNAITSLQPCSPSDVKEIGRSNIPLEDVKEIGRSNIPLEDVKELGRSNIPLEDVKELGRSNIPLEDVKELGRSNIPLEDVKELGRSNIPAH
ncbi:peptidase inhibitor family I36 protein [Streptomyces sp. NPDC086091]|uniref:peptidase inhibitor family I36 protein n=1 Tax=Streptomyces sp. NPDC086091 TaxID=3365751 RepID=UPI003802DC07